MVGEEFRQTEKPHEVHWYQDTEENLMKEYINRHYDESVLNALEELRRDAIYSGSDPRMHISKTSRTYMRPSMTISVIMDAFLTV